jgi:hypothetical protein
LPHNKPYFSQVKRAIFYKMYLDKPLEIFQLTLTDRHIIIETIFDLQSYDNIPKLLKHDPAFFLDVKVPFYVEAYLFVNFPAYVNYFQLIKSTAYENVINDYIIAHPDHISDSVRKNPEHQIYRQMILLKYIMLNITALIASNIKILNLACIFINNDHDYILQLNSNDINNIFLICGNDLNYDVPSKTNIELLFIIFYRINEIGGESFAEMWRNSIADIYSGVAVPPKILMRSLEIITEHSMNVRSRFLYYELQDKLGILINKYVIKVEGSDYVVSPIQDVNITDQIIMFRDVSFRVTPYLDVHIGGRSYYKYKKYKQKYLQLRFGK